MTPFQQILSIMLTNVQKLLVDHRIGTTLAEYTANPDDYDNSQFNTLYGSDAYDADTEADPDTGRQPFTGETSTTTHFYPLTMEETLDLQDVRILDYVQLGFIPIDDIEKYEAPSLFIANATDRARVEPGDRRQGRLIRDSETPTLQQVLEIIPLNFRLVSKEPNNRTIDKTNVVIVDKVLEGLKYVLNPDDYLNLSFPRRGYDQPTVIRKIEFVQALNLEEFFTPYEVVDFLFDITIREQRSRSKNV